MNVNSDILIVDEALAVGDAIFQHRCFRKIRSRSYNSGWLRQVSVARNLP